MAGEINAIMSRQDFDNILATYSGHRVSHIPTTKTLSNISGEETLTEGSAVNINVHFVWTSDPYDYNKSGLTQIGVAIMLSRIPDGVKKNDTITTESKKFRVQEIYDVKGTFQQDAAGTETVYSVCSLFEAD